MRPAAEALRARYLEWASSLDANWSRAARWPLGWSLLVAAFILLLLAASAFPAARGFFGLRLGPALVLLGLVLAAGLALLRLEAREALTPHRRAAGVLAAGFLLQACTSGLVALSEPPGAFALAGWPVAAAWYHLGIMRAGPRHPFGTLAHGAAMLAACALAPDDAHRAAFAPIALIGLGGGTVLGLLASRDFDEKAVAEAHRNALSAQSLAAFAVEIELAEAALVQARSGSDEAQRGLERARGACDELAAACDARGAGGAGREAVRAVEDALAHLSELLAWEPAGHGASANAADPAAAEPTLVRVLPVARAALADASRRWPEVSFSCSPPAPAEGADLAAVRGGDEALRAMLDPLLANACEGDGSFGASRVELAVACDPSSGEVEIEVADDGPGFPAEILALPIALLRSSKRRDGGIGLYTAESLCRSSGGTLAREQRPEGGARVRLRLPGAGRAPAAPGARP